MARFIKSQSLTLLEKLDALDADEQAANDCTNSQKNSRTASRFALRPKVKQEHNEADGGGHGFPVGVFVSRQARQGASGGFSGCRGAAMTQSRSDSGVYTGLTM